MIIIMVILIEEAEKNKNVHMVHVVHVHDVGNAGYIEQKITIDQIDSYIYNMHVYITQLSVGHTHYQCVTDLSTM